MSAYTVLPDGGEGKITLKKENLTVKMSWIDRVILLWRRERERKGREGEVCKKIYLSRVDPFFELR